QIKPALPLQAGPHQTGTPTDVITAKCAPHLRRGKPERRTTLINLDDYEIVRTFGAEYRGLVQYYLLAHDVARLNRLCWVAETSMLKTLAAKHNSTVSKMAARYRAKITTPHGIRTCFEASLHREGRTALVARFGGIPLKRQKGAILDDRVQAQVTYPRRELVTRLLKGRCELCQRAHDEVQVHQVRKLVELAAPGPDRPEWMVLMVRKRRKTLVVCTACHQYIHHGQHATPLTA
ncbi:MAG: hypothetical protein GEV04_24020, partial [Actinophytocola sp.]|nr:hypothetical protein [Actinophytocola sp.]